MPPLVADPKWVAQLSSAAGASRRGARVLFPNIKSPRRRGPDFRQLFGELFRKGGERKNARAAKTVANFITTDLLGKLNAEGRSIAESKISGEALGGLAAVLESGVISSKGAKEVFAKMWETGKPAEELVRELGLAQISDEGQVRQWVKDALAANPQAADDLKSGKERAIGSIVGAVMKLSKGKANPALVNRLIKETVAATA